MKYKKISSLETKFYVIELGPGKYAIYDSIWDAPIYVGSTAMAEGIQRKLKKDPKNVSIFYYTVEKNGGLKLSPQYSFNV